MECGGSTPLWLFWIPGRPENHPKDPKRWRATALQKKDDGRVPMRAMARALITAVAFFELSDDEVVDPDAALQVLEDIGGELSHCTPEEKAALKAAVAQMKASEQLNEARPEVLEFLESFLGTAGLDDEAGEDGAWRRNCTSRRAAAKWTGSTASRGAAPRPR